MTCQQRLKCLSVPSGKIDVILDTDAYNEIDDQFAISYMFKSKEKLNVKAICAAPFFNSRSNGAKDGMEKSYDEILKLLSLMNEKTAVFKGAEHFMDDEKTPVFSDASRMMAEASKAYSPDNPLYIVAIGAITNVASALIMNPEMKNSVVIVWLGGNAHHYHDTKEFNMSGDVAAARVVIQSGVPFVQLPCLGVVSDFSISGAELEYWLKGKNPLADYLARNTINEAESYAKGKPWTRIIWDVVAVAWLLNDNERFMKSKIIPAKIPDYNGFYDDDYRGELMTYVYFINRDALMCDLINKLI
jgi:inosine-uridine nucleoside N-ribohydrolase